MVNEAMKVKTIKLEHSKLLSAKDMNRVIENYLKSTDFHIESYTLKPASEGLLGFLADHYRIKVEVTIRSSEKKKEIHLFVKASPTDNEPKLKFIKENMFDKREAMMYDVLLKEFGGSEEPDPWRVPVLLCTEDLLVMPDLAARGFTSINKVDYMDFEHCSILLNSVARLHAGSVNFEGRRTLDSGKRYSILDHHTDILKEQNFKDTHWMRAGVRSLLNFCGTLSEKYNSQSELFPKVEKHLLVSCLDICHSLREYEEYPNVVIHKDLWANNILFRYDQVGKPVDAVLVDFQCIRYVPGVFDVAGFFYLSTDKALRDDHEGELLDIYYDAFMSYVQYKELGKIPKYSKTVFLESYELARPFGMLHALLISPYFLMDGSTAKDVFDDPVTYDTYMNVDRSPPMIDYARKHPLYKDRILNMMEEFVKHLYL